MTQTDSSAPERARQEVFARPPFSDDAAPTAEEKTRLRAAVELAGIREFPYPFASALAVASDIDGATRTSYTAYVGQLVRLLTGWRTAHVQHLGAAVGT